MLARIVTKPPDAQQQLPLAISSEASIIGPKFPSTFN
jgi:hypothetical protein